MQVVHSTSVVDMQFFGQKWLEKYFYGQIWKAQKMDTLTDTFSKPITERIPAKPPMVKAAQG